MSSIRAMDLDAYNERVRLTKERWYEIAVNNLSSLVKDVLKKKAHMGDIEREDGKSVLHFNEEISFPDGGYDVFSEDERKEAEELHTLLERVPMHERARVDDFFGKIIVDSRPYVSYKFKKAQRKIGVRRNRVNFLEWQLGLCGA